MLRWTSSAVSRQGPRDHNEDTCVAIDDLGNTELRGLWKQAHLSRSKSSGSSSNSTSSGSSSRSSRKQAFYAVYDGHCGAEASQFLANELHERILQSQVNIEGELTKAISLACAEADKHFLEYCRVNQKYAGTTALGVFLDDKHAARDEDGNGNEGVDARVAVGSLTIFNIGDCQAVLGRQGGEAMLLSESHKPGRSDEMERIKRAGGWITEEKDLYMGRVHLMDLTDHSIRERAQEHVQWNTIQRVCGDLAVSRSIGDPDYKNLSTDVPTDGMLFIFPDDHPRTFSGDLVIPDPDVTEVDVLASDEFLILASDGLWDVMEAQEAVSFTRRELEKHRSVDKAAAALTNHAVRLGTADNVTAIVVEFHVS